MVYDIYFHNDFDGIASAAVMLKFLESRGDKVRRYVPVTYDIRPRWPKLKFRRPTIIVDFYYHPQATFWFDHHPTSFIRESWRRRFRQGKFKRWETRYQSSCHLVIDALTERFGFRPPRHFAELTRWVDVVDSASYVSARQAVAMREPALRISEFLDSQKSGKSLQWFIRLLAEKPLAAVARDPRLRKARLLIGKQKEKLLKAYRRNLRLYGKLAYMDLTAIEGEMRYAPYYLHPTLTYTLTLKKWGRKVFHIGLGANPWRREQNKIHIGAFLRKHYGGGGHRDVGGAEFRSAEAANKAVREVISLLGNKQTNK